MKETQDNVTLAWQRYRRCADYKNRNEYYTQIDENYRYYEGDQWRGVESNGLPMPVFNIIKPVIRYKVSVIQQNDTSIQFSTEAIQDPDYDKLSEIAGVLTDYTKVWWEKQKMDYKNECMLTDAAISGNGFSYLYYDETKGEIVTQLIDGTNVYPANPNMASIQDQEYIVIAFRRPLSEVKREAENARKAKLNTLTKDEIETILPDRYTEFQAGDTAKEEVSDYDMCTVLLMFYKNYESGTIHFSKSTENCEIIKDTDLQTVLYPIAMYTWEPAKNYFFGLSDAKSLIPNQDYINTIAAMMMSSTTFSAIPKMIYNADLIDNPSMNIGEAIGISGGTDIRNAVGYISPSTIGEDAFKMFERTISLTKELQGANDGALGNVNPENASGKAILAVMEQTAVPLDSNKRRFYNYLEDLALILADLWRVYNAGSEKVVTIDGNDTNSPQSYAISPEAWNRLMLNVRIDVGATTRWNEVAMMQTLDNLMQQGQIDIEFYAQNMPASSGFPKQQFLDYISQMKDRQSQQQQAGIYDEAEDMLQKNTPDIDSLLGSLTDEQKQNAMQNPEYLKDIIAQQMGVSS